MQLNSPSGGYHSHVTTILLVSAIPMLMAIGVAVDTVHAANVEALMQKAADAAVADHDPLTSSSDEKIDVLVKTYLSHSGALAGLRTISKIEHGATKDGRLFVRIQGNIDTHFMTLVGISRMSVDVYSERIRVGGRSDLALEHIVSTSPAHK